MRTVTIRAMVVLIVCYAAILHFIWGLSFLGVGAKIAFTNVTLLNHLPNAQLEGVLLIAASVLAIVGLFPRYRTRWRLLLILPQQILLALSAASALMAVVQGHFGDGVPRSWPFILDDQLPLLIAYALHTLVLIGMAASSDDAPEVRSMAEKWQLFPPDEPSNILVRYLITSFIVIVSWLFTALFFWQPHHLTWPIVIFAFGLAVPMLLVPLGVFVLAGFFESSSKITEQAKEISELRIEIAGLKQEIIDLREQGRKDAATIQDLLIKLARPVDPTAQTVQEAGDAASEQPTGISTSVIIEGTMTQPPPNT